MTSALTAANPSSALFDSKAPNNAPKAAQAQDDQNMVIAMGQRIRQALDIDSNAPETSDRTNYLRKLGWQDSGNTPSRYDPAPLLLFMADRSAEEQRALANLQATAAVTAGMPDAPDSLTGLSIVDTFEDILAQANQDDVIVNNETLSKYAKFMSELSSLLTTLNGAFTIKEDKTYFDITSIINKLKAFRDTVNNEIGAIKTFTSQEQAEKFAESFRAGTVRVEKNGSEEYVVKFDLSPLKPVFSAISKDPEFLTKAYANGDRIEGSKELGDRYKWESLNSSAVAALNLGTSDAQKTYQTDLDLKINDLSRSISQFDNLTKLFSSMLSSLTEVFKGYLSPA